MTGVSALVRQKLASAPLDFRLAVLFSPAASRDALTTLLAIYFEIREIIIECHDPGVAEVKLRWWEQEIDALYAGQPRHPLTQALLPFKGALAERKIPFMDLITGTRMDVTAGSFQSYEDVKHYCYRHSGALAELSAALAGASTSEALMSAHLLGNSCRLADITTSGSRLALRGRVYFAADDLHTHGIDQHISGGQHSDSGLRNLLADYAQRSRQMSDEAIAGISPHERGSLAPWLILNRLALKRLRKFEQRGFSPDAEPVELPPLAALFTAWRAAQHLP